MQDHRANDRSFIGEVNCRAHGQSCQATTHKVSLSACVLESPYRFARADDEISITFWNNVRQTGTVTRVNGPRIAVRFTIPLHPAVLEHLGFIAPPSDRRGSGMKDNFGRSLPELNRGGRSHFV